jgi:hypothetical protein
MMGCLFVGVSYKTQREGSAEQDRTGNIKEGGGGGGGGRGRFELGSGGKMEESFVVGA